MLVPRLEVNAVLLITFISLDEQTAISKQVQGKLRRNYKTNGESAKQKFGLTEKKKKKDPGNIFQIPWVWNCHTVMFFRSPEA